jgi:digeranylgeranylglycerophospholipid reductase
MTNYDIAVVGAGPVGSTFARYATENGLEVAMLEKKKEVGVPLQCAGLLGKIIREVNILPDELILNQFYGAYLHSPSDIILSVGKKEPEAYVLDRVAYDKFLTQLAVDAGTELFLNHRVKKVNVKSGSLELQDKEISAEVIVGSDGHSSVVSSQFNPVSKTVQAAQYLVDMGEGTFEDDYVHLYVDSGISPGFLWLIPLSDSMARIGLFADHDYQRLNGILKKFLSNNHRASILKKYHGLIPVYDPKKKIVEDRAILLGDAASQVKPTTGGGLTMGFICAKIASQVVSRAIELGDTKILKDYDVEYRKIFENELKMQLKVQKSFKLFTNDDLDYMFLKLKEKDAESIISQYGNMDSQSRLVKEMLKTGLMFSILPKLLSRRIANLWNFF